MYRFQLASQNILQLVVSLFYNSLRLFRDLNVSKMRYLIITLISMSVIANITWSYKLFGSERKISEYLLPFLEYWSIQEPELVETIVLVADYMDKKNTNLFDSEDMWSSIKKIKVEERLIEKLWIIAQSLYSLIMLDTDHCDIRWLEPSLVMANTLFKLEDRAKVIGNYQSIMNETDEVVKYSKLNQVFSLRFKEIALLCLPQARENLKLFELLNDSVKIIDSIMEKTLAFRLMSTNKSEEERLYETAFRVDNIDGHLSDQEIMSCKNFILDTSDSLGLIILAFGFIPNYIDVEEEGGLNRYKLLEYSRLCYRLNNWRYKNHDEPAKLPVTLKRMNLY